MGDHTRPSTSHRTACHAKKLITFRADQIPWPIEQE